jgi:hypothetical protein
MVVLSRTRTYRIWIAMRARCKPAHPTHGSRGIRVCDRWNDSFDAFLADMGEAPPGLSIERENNDGNYEPGNCVWATAKVQQRNTRRNRMVTHKGETMCMAAWAERLGIRWDTLYQRMKTRGSPE